MSSQEQIFPPLSESHPSYLNVPRTLLLESDLQLSVNDFWTKFWANPSFWAKYGEGLGWSDTKVGPWQQSQPPGILERKCTWTIQLAAFGVGKSTPVHQIHKARLRKKDALILQLSSCTPEVVFGTDFSVEQQWEISSTGPQSCSFKVHSAVHWTNEPWGVGVMKGTIADRSADETRKSAAQFVTLVEQQLKSEKTPSKPALPPKTKSRKLPKSPEPEPLVKSPSKPIVSPPKPIQNKQPNSAGTSPSQSASGKSLELRREKSRISKELRKTEKMGESSSSPNSEEVSSSSSESSESEVIESPPVPDPVPVPEVTFPSVPPPSKPTNQAFATLTQLASLFQSVLTNPFVQGILLLILIFASWSMLSQIALLEGSLSLQPMEETFTKVLFLENFIEKLSQNITGNPNIMSEQYQRWKSSQELENELALWQQQLQEMIQKLRKEKEPLTPYQQQIFKKLDRLKDTEREAQSGWIVTIFNFFFYFIFVLFWLSVGALLLARQMGFISFQLPFVKP